ncbi:MAG: DinB family protein [Cytophagales bacterium]|nr:MAG: DinB family protein [Cytophagales bacterium]
MNKLATATDLQARLTHVLDTIEREFQPLTDAQLRTKPANGGWSIVECLQHLNLAERYYVRQLQHKVDKVGFMQHNPNDQELESNLLGRLTLRFLDPTSTTKLPAPGMVRPRAAADLNVAEVMASFLELQTLQRDLLGRLVYLDWNGQKVMTPFGKWIKMRLGDVVQMLVVHTERHLAQAMRVKAGLSL